MRRNQVTVTCQKCGKSFEKAASVAAKAKFCSLACAGKKSGKPRSKPMATCEQCGIQFYPYVTNNPGRFCSKKCYDAWQRRDRLEKACEVCGKQMSVKLSNEKYAKAGRRLGGVRFCSKACQNAGMTTRGIGRQHNGKDVTIDNNGYLRIWEPDNPDAHSRGWMLEHRYVAAAQLGRRLRADEQVHHVNGIKTDNRPENLAVLDPVAHTLITVDERGLRRAAAQRRIRELEAELARYRERFGPLD